MKAGRLWRRLLMRLMTFLVKKLPRTQISIGYTNIPVENGTSQFGSDSALSRVCAKPALGRVFLCRHGAENDCRSKWIYRDFSKPASWCAGGMAGARAGVSRCRDGDDLAARLRTLFAKSAGTSLATSVATTTSARRSRQIVDSGSIAQGD